MFTNLKCSTRSIHLDYPRTSSAARMIWVNNSLLSARGVSTAIQTSENNRHPIVTPEAAECPGFYPQVWWGSFTSRKCPCLRRKMEWPSISKSLLRGFLPRNIQNPSCYEPILGYLHQSVALSGLATVEMRMQSNMMLSKTSAEDFLFIQSRHVIFGSPALIFSPPPMSTWAEKTWTGMEQLLCTGDGSRPHNYLQPKSRSKDGHLPQKVPKRFWPTAICSYWRMWLVDPPEHAEPTSKIVWWDSSWRKRTSKGAKAATKWLIWLTSWTQTLHTRCVKSFKKNPTKSPSHA